MQVTQNKQQSRVWITAFKSWLCSCQQPLSPADNQRQRAGCGAVFQRPGTTACPAGSRWPLWIWASPRLVQSTPCPSPLLAWMGTSQWFSYTAGALQQLSTASFSQLCKNRERWSCGSRFLTPRTTGTRGPTIPTAARMEPGDQHRWEVDFGGLETCLGAQPCCLKAFSHAPPWETACPRQISHLASPGRGKAQTAAEAGAAWKIGQAGTSQACKGWRVSQAPAELSGSPPKEGKCWEHPPARL